MPGFRKIASLEHCITLARSFKPSDSDLFGVLQWLYEESYSLVIFNVQDAQIKGASYFILQLLAYLCIPFKNF
jgi:hypothetical protein